MVHNISMTSIITTYSPIIVALDYSNINKLFAFVNKISPQYCRIKIGKELFVKTGPNLIKILKKRGFDIFLDLKFYDIPNTVFKAVTVAATLGVWMINVHAIGGEKMMMLARKALIPFGKNAPLLIAVTVLTSMTNSDLHNIGINLNVLDYTIQLAILAQKCGLDGVICSPCEANKLRSICRKNFILVCPGIRPNYSKSNDQRRIMTPYQAKQAGVNYIVIGRPITTSIDPLFTIKNILKEIH